MSLFDQAYLYKGIKESLKEAYFSALLCTKFSIQCITIVLCCVNGIYHYLIEFGICSTIYCIVYKRIQQVNFAKHM